jgi:hypothetical protein
LEDIFRQIGDVFSSHSPTFEIVEIVLIAILRIESQHIGFTPARSDCPSGPHNARHLTSDGNLVMPPDARSSPENLVGVGQSGAWVSALPLRSSP